MDILKRALMTPKGGVLAILLPFAEDKLMLDKPCKIGDRLPKTLMQSIFAIAPYSFPASIFEGASMGLSVGSEFSSRLVRFSKLLDTPGASDVQIHLLIVSSRKLLSAEVYLERTGLLPCLFFSINDHPILRGLFAFHSIPHAVHIDHLGRVESIREGNYLEANEIRTGAHDQSKPEGKSIKKK